jgi:hypothetical protein
MLSRFSSGISICTELFFRLLIDSESIPLFERDGMTIFPIVFQLR